MPKKRYVPVKVAAEHLGCAEASVRRLIAGGLLKGKKRECIPPTAITQDDCKWKRASDWFVEEESLYGEAKRYAESELCGSPRRTHFCEACGRPYT